ncbi:hypothetical protein ACFVVA_36820 [Kitasatospora sp. NPDC058048]|uniref:hypothetical protein n=1 Tax=Kitasatospora sp. NPDC058048 TaxID=3346313 RepID=UPI0036DAAD82
MTVGNEPRGFGDLFKDAAEATAAGGPSSPPGGQGKTTVRPKYAQIRPDQWTGLDELARTLMDARTVIGGPRITANTLIRVAIDALLATRGSLVGNEEEELRRRYFQTLGIKENPK